MSIRAMSVVWDSDLETSCKFILLYYADRGSDEGENIWPAVSTVAKKTGYSTRTVQRITNQMVMEGLLTPDGKGPKGTNRYKINLEAVRLYPPPIGGDMMSPLDIRGDIDATGGVTLTPKRGDTMSPEPLLTNNKEPSVKTAAASAALPPKPPRKVKSSCPEPDWNNLTVLKIKRIPEIDIFIQVTNRYPGSAQLPIIYRCIREHAFTVDYLRPFWEDWISHGWRSNNLAWLLDWAVKGAIPVYQQMGKQSPLDRSQNVLKRELQDALFEESHV